MGYDSVGESVRNDETIDCQCDSLRRKRNSEDDMEGRRSAHMAF